jgi:hypothetical protein
VLTTVVDRTSLGGSTALVRALAQPLARPRGMTA